MIFERVKRNGKWGFVTTSGNFELQGIHEENSDCQTHGCVVHNPTPNPLWNAPYNWREDRALMERICRHGIGHPDIDSANYLRRTGQRAQLTHACDGCCVSSMRAA